jgi:hemerythrin-like domain-containing protein
MEKEILPIGLLMTEHRLIERMVKLMDIELTNIVKKGEVNASFIDTAADFLRTYADKCHHGKEEDILFRDLDKKPIPEDHRRIMNELIHEHVLGRENVKKLIAAKESYIRGDKGSLGEITSNMESLTRFYPKHIEKEDKHFFLAVMGYFSEEEKEKMLEESYDFDNKLASEDKTIHEKYTKIVESLEEAKEASGLPPCDTSGTAEHGRPLSEDGPCEE